MKKIQGSIDAEYVSEMLKRHELETEREQDTTNPDHYKQNLFQTIDEMLILFGKETVISFCVCNAWKYRSRAESSGKKEQDLKKANWYIEKAFALRNSVLYESGRKTNEYNTMLKDITGSETLAH